MEIILIAAAVFIVIKYDIVRALISWYKKSDAATAFQNLLEHQKKFGFFEGDPARSATEYIQDTWNYKPDIFNGKFGQRPHKVSVVIYSLALAVTKLNNRRDQNFNSVMVALCNALSEVETNGVYYPLTSIDRALIEEAVKLTAPLMNLEIKKAEAVMNGF